MTQGIVKSQHLLYSTLSRTFRLLGLLGDLSRGRTEEQALAEVTWIVSCCFHALRTLAGTFRLPSKTE
eukprot:scaffold7363_cov60-Cylindrotheca_fusiformis.AAC.1